MNKSILQRIKRKKRIRARFYGTGQRPRVSVFRSNQHLFVQLVDDLKKITILGVGDQSLDDKKDARASKVQQAFRLGSHVAQLAQTKKIKAVVFDRGGYRYHGRVKALAEGLREGGLVF